MMIKNIKRSNRKTLALYILKDGSLEIRAPKNVSEAVISDFILSKRDWIKKHTEKARERNIKKNEFSVKIGDSLLYKGKEYKLLPKEGNSLSFDYENFYMPDNITFEALKPAFISLYRKLAKTEIIKKAEYYSKIMNVEYSNIKINSAKTRWGSCSGKNSLNFSWKLILADDDTVSYVVVHELAHIIEHNHSAEFWKTVERFFPNYKECKKKLKQLQKKLSMENWD